MNKRQRAKSTAGKKAGTATNPLQEAWDVVAEHLLSLHSMGNAFFVDTAYPREHRQLPEGTRLRVHNTLGFELVSKILKEG